jgi:hypothetical protein
MPFKLTAANAYIFRIAHRGNMARILAEGCHCRNSVQAKSGYIAIGNEELIDRRQYRGVPCGPSGTLADYVPFYFTPYSPMMYNIKTGRGVPQRSMADIVILVSSLHHLDKLGVSFVFTDRHAYLAAAQFSANLDDLEDMIIWPVLQSRDFRKDDADKFEKYQAEALIHNHVPLNALLGIVCYDDTVKAALQAEAEQLNVAVKIAAQRKWYV